MIDQRRVFQSEDGPDGSGVDATGQVVAMANELFRHPEHRCVVAGVVAHAGHRLHR